MSVPRRSNVNLLTPAERAIYAAQQAVERMPADERLTRAVALLAQARDAVADYVEQTYATCAVCGSTRSYDPVLCDWRCSACAAKWPRGPAISPRR